MKVEVGSIRSKEDESIDIKKLDLRAKIWTQGSRWAAGNELYAKERGMIVARGQGVFKTGISIKPLRGTYGDVA